MPIGSSNRVGYGKIADPGLMSELLQQKWFPQTCTFERKTESRLPMGGLSYAWANVTDFVDLPCRKFDRLPHEGRTLEIIEEEKFWSVMLASYYPNIDPAWRLVMDTGEIYDIEGVDGDSLHLYTVVVCRIFSPVAQPGV